MILNQIVIIPISCRQLLMWQIIKDGNIAFAYHILMIVELKNVELAQINFVNVKHQIHFALFVQLQILDNYHRILFRMTPQQLIIQLIMNVYNVIIVFISVMGMIIKVALSIFYSIIDNEIKIVVNLKQIYSSWKQMLIFIRSLNTNLLIQFIIRMPFY